MRTGRYLRVEVPDPATAARLPAARQPLRLLIGAVVLVVGVAGVAVARDDTRAPRFRADDLEVTLSRWDTSGGADVLTARQALDFHPASVHSPFENGKAYTLLTMRWTAKTDATGSLVLFLSSAGKAVRPLWVGKPGEGEYGEEQAASVGGGPTDDDLYRLAQSKRPWKPGGLTIRPGDPDEGWLVAVYPALGTVDAVLGFTDDHGPAWARTVPIQRGGAETVRYGAARE